jgi:pteridine reductase
MTKTALITGGAKRIGKAMAKHLAASGWNIVVHFNSSEKPAAELVEALQNKYRDQSFLTVKADLSRENEVENLIPSIISRVGNLELLINNASVFKPSGLAKTTGKLYNTHMDVNLKAPFILMRDFALHCKSGYIINLADTRITRNKTDYAAYSLSKKALWELTKMAALEFAPHIRVNAIAPGVTLPPEGENEDYLWKLAEKIPMQKPGGTTPILRSLDFILENSHLTGQLIFADGGENLGHNT